jgi:hypothetical protein
MNTGMSHRVQKAMASILQRRSIRQATVVNREIPSSATLKQAKMEQSEVLHRPTNQAHFHLRAAVAAAVVALFMVIRVHLATKVTAAQQLVISTSRTLRLTLPI